MTRAPWSLAFLTIAALALGGCAPSGRSPGAPGGGGSTDRVNINIALPIQQLDLPNGLHVVLHQERSASTALVYLRYHVGSKDDPQGRSGFAHFFEHLMFRGSKNTAKKDYKQWFEDIGGETNASTSLDYTDYHAEVPPSALARAIWLEADRMAYPLAALDEAGFAAERDVVKNELRERYENAPLGNLTAIAYEAAYGADHPGSVQSSVAIGWRGPRSSEPDLVVLDVLASATAGDLSTRLNITVRKELGATYGVRMAATSLRDGGLIRISAAIDTARTVEAMKGLFTELGRLRTEPLTPGELGAAKLRTYHELEHSSTRGLARYLAYALAEDKPVADAVTYNARVDVITADDVRASAEKWLALDEARVVIVGDAARIADGLRALGIGDVVVTTPR